MSLWWLAVWACAEQSPPPATADAIEVQDPNRVRFVAIGDQGEGNASQRLVGKAMGTVCAERGCDFAVLLGDNVYPRGFETPDDDAFERRYDPYYPPLGLPIVAVLGNHDYGHGTEEERADWQLAAAAERDSLVMPARYFQVQAGPATLAALDTNAVFWGRHQHVQARLLDEVAKGDARWKVAIGHHPFRSNGPHGNAGAYEGQWWLPVASGGRLRSLFSDHVCGSFDLYLSGHEHTLQWLEHCDTHWVVSGAGSKATRLVDRGNQPRFASAQEGLVWVELAEALTVAVYDQHGSLLHEATARR